MASCQKSSRLEKMRYSLTICINYFYNAGRKGLCLKKCVTDKVTFYNKGDRSDCNNYSSISLLNIVEKGRAQVRPNVATKLVGQRSPWPFHYISCRRNGVCSNMAFIDLTKTFGLVSRKGLLLYCKRSHVHPCSLGWLYPPTRTCNKLSGMIAKREIPSQSRVALSRVACSPQHFFGIFSFPTLSESPWTVSFFTPKVMAACMTLPMTGALLRPCLFWLCPDYQHKEDWSAWAECEEHPGH